MWTLHGARVSGGQRAWVSANPVGLSQPQSGGHESAAIRRAWVSGDPAGIESEAGRRALSQRRAGGHWVSGDQRAWGSGNPGTRQPAGGLGIAPASGPNRARDQRTRGTRGDPAELPLIIRGLERDDEGDFLAARQTEHKNKTKDFWKRKTKRGEWAPLTVRSGLLSRCTQQGGTRTRRRERKLK